MAFEPAKIIQETGEWIKKPSNTELLLNSELAAISDAIRQVSDRSIARIGSAMGRIATWYSNNGVFSVGTGDPRGWKHLVKSFHARYWHDRILMRLTDLDKRGNKQARVLPNAATLTLLNALAFDASAYIGRFAADYERWLMATKLWDIAFWKETTLQDGLPAFVIFLSRVYAGNSPSESAKVLPPAGYYDDVIVGCTEALDLEGAILKMCDYHIARIFETDDHIAEFAWLPYDILPVEYLALRQVRMKLGLSTPKPQHVLLDTPFANPPHPLPEVHDELFDRAIAAARELIPDL